MQNLIVSFNAIAPLFLLIIIGFFIRQKGLLRSDALPQLNSLAFTIFLPALLFNNLYTTNVESAFSPRLIGYAVFAALAAFRFKCSWKYSSISSGDGSRIIPTPL